MGGLRPQMTKNYRLYRRPTPRTGQGGRMCKRLLKPTTEDMRWCVRQHSRGPNSALMGVAGLCRTRRVGGSLLFVLNARLGRYQNSKKPTTQQPAYLAAHRESSVAHPICHNCLYVRTLPTVAEETACRGIFRHRLGRGRLGSTQQYRAHPNPSQSCANIPRSPPGNLSPTRRWAISSIAHLMVYKLFRNRILFKRDLGLR